VEDESDKAPAKIIIGFKTRLVEGAEKHAPDFKAPANYKDAAKIAEYVATQRAEFLAAAKDMPYTGTLDEVTLVDPKNDKNVIWKYPAADESKPPVAVRVKNYLLKYYPTAWDFNLTRRQPQVIFFGFDIKLFLKLVGIECAMPGIAKPCPLNLWYGNSDHRDTTEIVMPKDNCKGMTLPYVLKFWRPADPEKGKLWDALIADWPGPGQTTYKDAAITCDILRWIGLMKE
jgi:hypothetical protein